MTTRDELSGGPGITPEHDSYRQAIRWISARRQERPEARLHELVSEASRQFDLSPKDELSLLALLSGGDYSPR